MAPWTRRRPSPSGRHPVSMRSSATATWPTAIWRRHCAGPAPRAPSARQAVVPHPGGEGRPRRRGHPPASTHPDDRTGRGGHAHRAARCRPRQRRHRPGERRAGDVVMSNRSAMKWTDGVDESLLQDGITEACGRPLLAVVFAPSEMLRRETTFSLPRTSCHNPILIRTRADRPGPNPKAGKTAERRSRDLADDLGPHSVVRI